MGRGPPSNAGEAEDDTELAHSAMSDSHARSAVNKGQRESNPSTPDGRPMCSSVGLASDAGLHLPHPFSAPVLRCVVLDFSCTPTKLLRPTKRIQGVGLRPTPPHPAPVPLRGSPTGGTADSRCTPASPGPPPAARRQGKGLGPAAWCLPSTGMCRWALMRSQTPTAKQSQDEVRQLMHAL